MGYIISGNSSKNGVRFAIFAIFCHFFGSFTVFLKGGLNFLEVVACFELLLPPLPVLSHFCAIFLPFLSASVFLVFDSA